MRQVAKICLNFEKVCQQCGLDEYEFTFEYNTLIRKFINNNQIKDATWNIISEDCVELRYKEKKEMFIESDYLSEITAVFEQDYIKSWIGYTPPKYAIAIPTP